MHGFKISRVCVTFVLYTLLLVLLEMSSLFHIKSISYSLAVMVASCPIKRADTILEWLEYDVLQLLSSYTEAHKKQPTD